jgi:hypothetical protein
LMKVKVLVLEKNHLGPNQAGSTTASLHACCAIFGVQSDMI